ncbi:unnamed protein product [Musa acuminata var. zebrina]
MIQRQIHGAPPRLFTGTAFMPTPGTQIAADPLSPAKNRGSQGVLPLTAKQIAAAYHSGVDKSALSIDGIDVTNVRLLGLVMNKVERVTDVTFTLDDGTGRIDINRWINEAPDANEVTAIQNGIYVKVHGHLKGFHSKRHASAFSVRPVNDFNEVVLHFIECIFVHMDVKKIMGGGSAQIPTNLTAASSFPNGAKEYPAPFSHQFSAYVAMDGPGNNICNIVWGVFQEPANLGRENGLHVDEIVRKLGIPKNTVINAINYLVDVGYIYSTVDECHFKSAYNG